MSPIITPARQLVRGSEACNVIYEGDEKVWPYEKWIPTALPGLAVWLDAVDYIPGNWLNKGFGLPISIVGSPAMTVGPNKNGLPLVHFASNQARVRGGWNTNVNNYTVIYVVHWTGPYGNRIFSVQYPPSNLLIGAHSSGRDLAYDNGTFIYGPQNAWWSPPESAPWRMYGADSQEGAGFRFFINGVLIGSANGVGGMTNGWGLSGYDAVTATETTDFDFAEMVIYNRKLLDSERQEVEAYLREKWGLT